MSHCILTRDELIAQADIPTDGILSRTLYNDDHVKLIIFGFDTGQDLSEHTASMPAMLYFASGEADLTVGDTPCVAREGATVYMTPNTPHSVVAKTPVVMLLTLLKPQG